MNKKTPNKYFISVISVPDAVGQPINLLMIQYRVKLIDACRVGQESSWLLGGEGFRKGKSISDDLTESWK